MEDLILFYPEGHQAHFEAGHPESPDRIEIVRNSLAAAGWWDPFPCIPPLDLPLSFLERVHDSRYLKELELACHQGLRLDSDTYTTPSSWQLALNAAGGAAGVAEAVWNASSDYPNNPKKRGFSLSRPPGHHAERKRGMGFCLINNIAVAAEYLISGKQNEAQNANRIAIVDLDLHHGNGTQDIFWQRRDVLFVSTHQSPLYPGTGQMEEVGEGDGFGFNLNLPFPPGTGDIGYRVAMDEIILPMLGRFQPEMILVSLGFDPHWRDPLGHLLLTAAGYGGLVKSLVEWADQHCRSRISLVLEGGYDPIAVSACALATTAALLGEPIKDTAGSSPRPQGKSWQTIITKAKSIWDL